jgi:electron transport complex protein RnfE
MKETTEKPVQEKSQAGNPLQRAGHWLKENFGVEKSEAGRIALNGLIFQNPTFVLLLGMCPTLAVTTSLQNGLGMGLSTAAVLACSNLAISLLRKVIPNEIRIASYIVVIATFVTAVDLLLQAFVPTLSAALGLYIPLIVVNCIILGRAESFASRHKPGSSFLDGLFMGLGFTGALALLGAIREILGAGTIWGVSLPGISAHPVGLILSPCGGFMTLGCLIALVQWLRARPRKGGSKT